ncbi:MAG TPA: SCO family protein [Vicinamibacterales bacterium]|nr:SCO family protein [Vicinamibacterales bacterium]
MTTRSCVRRLTFALAFAILLPGSAIAQMTGTSTSGYKREAGATSESLPAPLREIGFDQNIGRQLPLDAAVVDERGRTHAMRDYFGARPVVLVFAYYTCPMLCTQVVNGLASAVGVLSLQPGRDFDVVVVSFDPHDTPATASEKKAQYLERYKATGAAAASHFLTASPDSIARLTKAAGFRYVWDTETQQFAHPTGVIVVTPDGRMARYLFGIEYGPRDLRLALVEASSGKVGTVADTLLLYCYHYDPTTGRYGVPIMRALRIGGASTVLALGALVFVLMRREKRQARG